MRGEGSSAMSQMTRFEHGGDVYTHEGVVDFSANINPLGMPRRVLDALRESVQSFDAYPDLECRQLRASLARAEGVPASQILCTAGATDLMHRICTALKPQKALVTAPCFSGYEQALEQSGIEIARHPLREEDGFNLTASILEHIVLTPAANSEHSIDGKVSDAVSGECSSPAAHPSAPWRAPRSAQGADAQLEPAATSAASAVRKNGRNLLFLCSPNNPTGLTIDRGLLVRILEAARRSDVVVVLDECFLDFTREPSAVSLCDDFPNLVVMRAFTKLFAMAGLRLGYGICSDAQLIEAMKAAGQPWAVSTPAQVAGVAALEEAGWAQRTREYVDEQRAVLCDGLRDAGMRVIPGQANYLLFQSPIELYEPLLERGFLIRRCANYVGLDWSWFRIAVRTEDENAAFLAALEDVVRSASGRL